ncbi:hypothetical protein ACHAWO_010742 [Cyclotella atomus]|uniref:Tc1-like transposase DDE domain-containing protein n=1 Tax=Cyclotella atomus TaxID=382360 RepID=A0ABD3NTP1_9STRA
MALLLMSTGECARGVRDEMVEDNGDILDPAVIVQQRVKGPEPSRTNVSYVERLYVMTGTITSTSTVSRWFNHYFPISGGFRKPNLVLIDKFKQENFWRAEEYLEAIATIAPKKLRFGDEELKKGAEVYCRRTRRCVLTAPSDFRNAYSVYGMCGIDESTPALYWRIHTSYNDSVEFSYDVERACCLGYLRAGDVLVLDNAAIHTGKSNKYLDDFVWTNFGVFILFLPTRTPEWNPQELVWQVMVKGMQHYLLRVLREVSSHSPAHAANKVLGTIDHKMMICNNMVIVMDITFAIT